MLGLLRVFKMLHLVRDTKYLYVYVKEVVNYGCCLVDARPEPDCLLFDLQYLKKKKRVYFVISNIWYVCVFYRYSIDNVMG